MNFIELRKSVIKKYFGSMNDRQFDAVTTVNGPLLVLAGAGSGKTTVLVNRILNLVKFGNGYKSNYIPNYTPEELTAGEDYLKGITDDVPDFVFSDYPAEPWQILAITFTNKAAGELKDRISQKLGPKADDIWAGTFHSICGKILRRNADRIGYSSHFTIYDTDDSRRVMKEIMKENSIDEKFLPPKSVLNAISRAKDSLQTPLEMEAQAGNDFRLKMIAQLYKEYQRALFSADAMDFDDMIVNTVRLLEKNEDILEYYTNKFRYCLVDEYQDTNHAQYVLVSLLASGKNNLCVVGDDDQSIYRFRGATIENILNFEDDYSDAVTIRLEQNYRSTSNILDAANQVISKNLGRKGKTLWTDNGEGSKIRVHTANDEREEARFVADSILDSVKKGGSFYDHAVLYRMNAQSNSVENAFVRSGIPYKVIGGMKFYDRKEIKDVMAYLHLINNNRDDLRLKRIINEPKRSIGDVTVSKASEIALQLGEPLFEILKRADEFAPLSRASARLKGFCDIIDDLTELSYELSLTQLFDAVLEKTGYMAALIAEGDEGKDRVDNVKEFSSNIAQYELESQQPSLSEFLEQIALLSDVDTLDDSKDYVVLMTIHSAKGLEFNNVYLIGMEEGIFPGNQSISGGFEEIEEERRLAYVAITRAKKNLTITNTFMRMLYGSTSRNLPSRFVKDIPEKLCESSGYASNLHKLRDNLADLSSSGYKYTSSYSTGSMKVSSSLVTPKSDNNASQYKVGMQVKHRTFGTGVILSVTPMSGDCMLEIAFDEVGTKKLMANFAKLTF